MTKQEALALFNNNGSALARALGISKQAVSHWPEDRVPEAQELKIRYRLIPRLKDRERRRRLREGQAAA